MIALGVLFLALGQNGQIESKEFPKETQAAVLRATVWVANNTRNVEASAVIIKQEGKFVYLLTAGHVARKDEQLQLRVFTEESYPKAAENYKSVDVLATDKEHDLALLRLATTDKMPGVLPLCPPKKVKALDDREHPFQVLSCGCGPDKAPVCQLETVRRKVKVQRRGDKETTLTWELAEAPARGRSGGPLVDKRGFVIGVASGASDGQGYYVHIDEINRFLKANTFEWLYEEGRK